MALGPGIYRLDPANGTLVVKTGRRGPAAKAGHDLTIEVRVWEAELDIAQDRATGTLRLTADATSLHVTQGVGGLQPLGSDDVAQIRRSIGTSILQGKEIEFRSTEISAAGGRVAVTGQLRIGSRTHPVSFAIDGDGTTLSASATIDQRDWGIKPFSALMGALKVEERVTVEVEGRPRLQPVRPLPTPSTGARHAPVDDDSIEALETIARTRLENGDVGGAIRALQAIIDTGHPVGAPRAAANLGALYEDGGDGAAARRCYRIAIESGHADHAPRARVNLALLLQHEGDVGGATRELRSVIATGHVNEEPRARLMLGYLHEEQGDARAAIEQFERVIASGHPERAASAAIALGAVHQNRRDPDAAVRAFQTAIRVGAGDEVTRAQILLGLTYKGRGELGRAAEVVQAAVERGGSADIVADARQLLAEIAALQRAAGPIRQPRPATQTAPIETEEARLRTAARAGDLGAALALGEILQRRGDLDMAQNAYEWVESKGDVRGSLKLAAFMEDQRKDLVAAEAAWRRADEAGDLNGAGNLARLLREKGDLRGAEAAFRRCAERGSLRAAIDYAGLLSQRRDATRLEIAAAVALLCEAEDHYLFHDDGMLMAAPLVFEGLQERCDPNAIETGLRRADAEGSATAAFRLGDLHRERGELRDALAAHRRAIARGEPLGWSRAAEALLALGEARAAEATAQEGERTLAREQSGGAVTWRRQEGAASAAGMLGAILDQRGDLDGGLAAYRRADAGGNAFGSFNLGIELRNRGDLRGAVAALERAAERGASDAQTALVEVRRRLAR